MIHMIWNNYVRLGRNQRGGRKNYDDNAVPNFVDSAGEEDDLISEVEGEHGVKIKKKIGKKGKKEEGDQLAEIIEDPLIVDKILSHRTAKRKRDDESVKSSDNRITGSNLSKSNRTLQKFSKSWNKREQKGF